MAIKGLTAVLLLSAVATSAVGQSLVATKGNPLLVAASYGYSQAHHDGEWIRVDVAVQSDRNGTMRLHEAFSLLTPDGVTIDLPSQRDFRAGIDEIQAMQARAANMQLSPWLAMEGSCLGTVGVLDVGRDHRCGYQRLWGNVDVDWTASVGPAYQTIAADLYFHSPDGWPAGEYTLVVDGPGDLEARLPVRLH